jgi:hypothetical protein
MSRELVLLFALVLDPRRALADRPWHGSVSAGGTLLLTGDQGDRGRLELEADVEPGSRFGALVAWRAASADHRGLLCGGLIYEAGAARPRLVLDLHADAGLDLDSHAPVLGGGLRATLAAIGWFGVAFDAGAYLVIDGVDATRLMLAASASIAATF